MNSKRLLLNHPISNVTTKSQLKTDIQVHQHKAYAQLPVTDMAVRYLLMMCNTHSALPLQSCLQGGMQQYIPWTGTEADIIST
jgi:hypothetical protein